MSIPIARAFEELFRPTRYKVYWGGRGGAKSWAFAQALLLQGAEKPLRILCTRENQNSIQDSVHKLLCDTYERVGLGWFYEHTKTEIRGKNGTHIVFMGIRHDPQKIKSMEGIDRCWVEEADKVSDASWRFLIPTIRKAGSEIWVSFNPGLKTDATYQRFIIHPPPNALVKKVGHQDNPWFPQELRDEMEHDKRIDYDEYMHIWEGELKEYADGAIYGEQLKRAKREGRITDVPIEQTVVHTFWDLGRNDATAIWFLQRVGLQNRLIDYYENRLVDIEHYAQVLRDKGYTYGEHNLPHDVEIQVLGMTQNRKSMFEDLGVQPISVVPRVKSVEEGLAKVRKIFPTLWFDKTRCEKGLDALANYQYVYDEEVGTHRQLPLHNWASNGADALRQLAQGWDPDTEWDREEIDYPDIGIV